VEVQAARRFNLGRGNDWIIGKRGDAVGFGIGKGMRCLWTRRASSAAAG
jgi:hypothetical protein